MKKTLIYVGIVATIILLHFGLGADQTLFQIIYLVGGIALLIWAIRFAILSANKKH